MVVFQWRKVVTIGLYFSGKFQMARKAHFFPLNGFAWLKALIVQYFGRGDENENALKFVVGHTFFKSTFIFVLKLV